MWLYSCVLPIIDTSHKTNRVCLACVALHRMLRLKTTVLLLPRHIICMQALVAGSVWQMQIKSQVIGSSTCHRWIFSESWLYHLAPGKGTQHRVLIYQWRSVHVAIVEVQCVCLISACKLLQLTLCGKVVLWAPKGWLLAHLLDSKAACHSQVNLPALDCAT